MRIRFRGRRSAKGVTLGGSARFGVAALLLLDFRAQKVKPALLSPLGFSDLDLVTSLTG